MFETFFSLKVFYPGLCSKKVLNSQLCYEITVEVQRFLRAVRKSFFTIFLCRN